MTHCSRRSGMLLRLITLTSIVGRVVREERQFEFADVSTLLGVYTAEGYKSACLGLFMCRNVWIPGSLVSPLRLNDSLELAVRHTVRVFGRESCLLTCRVLTRRLLLFDYRWASAGRVAVATLFAVRLVTWLILPEVICLSQRLSHACLRTSLTKVKPRMAH